ncbi:hypothetical protein H5P36_18985 [Bacillus sp. APMAM]|nr:hypothetical protein [Bacillus sp. APMAM]RTZ54365.1 hypothetical protein EKO25_18455 [Bacillus sp. SAJ1]
MAYQPKSSRKFITGVASAALVASAVAPVASSAAAQSPIVKVYQANNIVAYKGQSTKDLKINPTVKGKVKVKYKNGKTAWVAVKWENVTFKKAGSQTVYGTIAGTKLKAKVKVTVKVDSVAYVNNQQNASIDEGSTKEDLLKVLPAKVKVRLASGKTQLNDASYDLSKVDFTKPGDYKVTVHAAHSDAKLDRQITVTVKAVNVSVTGVSAVNQSELTVTGAGLGKLQASDITVAGTGVASVTAAADGKTAAVKLNGTLAPNKDTKVSVKQGTETKDFTVNFKFDPQAVAIKADTFDDDTKNQALTVTVDGVQTSVDYLLTAGYTVEFNAYDKDGVKVTSSFFKSASQGILADTVDPGNYTVQVVVAKDSKVLTSERTAVTVTNLDNAASTFKDYDLTENNSGIALTNTLVVGESATFANAIVGNGNSVTSTNSFTVKSSDSSVVSVNGKVIKAEGIGTATITLTVGKVTKDVTITVKGEQRKATSLAAGNIKTLVIGGAEPTVAIKVLDQYGNAYKGNVNITLPTSVTFANGADVSGIKATGANGVVTLNLPVTTNGQSGSIIVKDLNGNTIGSTSIKTSEVNNKASVKLVGSSLDGLDDTINADDVTDNSASYILKYYTSENVANGTLTNSELNGYYVKFNGKVISVNGKSGSTTDQYKFTGSLNDLTILPLAAGTTTLAVYDSNDKLVDTRTITVLQGQPAITGVAWKSVSKIDYTKTINYADVLDVTKAASGDDIVKGLTLSSTVVNNIRIAHDDATVGTTTIHKGDLYIDKDDSGSITVGDVAIGHLNVTVSSDFVGQHIGSDAYTGISVAEGSKGTLTFSVTDLVKGNNDVIATKAVTVDVNKTAADIAKQANIDTAKTKLAALTYSAANTITDATKLAAAKAQYDAAKTAVDTAFASGAVESDLGANYSKLADQKTEINRYVAAAAAATLADLNAAKTAVEGATYTLVNADTAATAKGKVKTVADGLTAVSSKSFTTTVTDVDFQAPVNGTTDGSYKFTVKLTAADGQTVTTATITAVVPK